MWKGGIIKNLYIPGFQHGNRKNKKADSKPCIFGPEEEILISTFPLAFPLLSPWQETNIEDTRKTTVSVPVHLHSTCSREVKGCFKVTVQKHLDPPFLSFRFYQPPNQYTDIGINFTSYSSSVCLKCSLKSAAWNSTIYAKHEEPGKIKLFLI